MFITKQTNLYSGSMYDICRNIKGDQGVLLNFYHTLTFIPLPQTVLEQLFEILNLSKPKVAVAYNLDEYSANLAIAQGKKYKDLITIDKKSKLQQYFVVKYTLYGVGDLMISVGAILSLLISVTSLLYGVDYSYIYFIKDEARL